MQYSEDIVLKINTKTKEVVSSEFFPCKYIEKKIETYHYVVNKETKEKVLTDDFPAVIESVDGDITTYHLYGAYTHTIRHIL
jgi:hypothetical protein